jgi:hypothetical protein
MLTTLERLARARELRTTVIDIGAGAGAKKRIMLGRKAESLRDLLLDRRAAVSVSDLDLFNPAGSFARMREHFDAIPADDEFARIEAAQYMQIVTGYLLQSQVSTGGDTSYDTPGRALQRDLSNADQSHRPAYLRAQFTRLHAAGGEALDAAGPLREARSELLLIAADESSLASERDIMLKASLSVALASVKDHEEAMNAARALARNGEMTWEELKPIEDRYAAAHREAMNGLRAAVPDFPYDGFRAARTAAEAAMKAQAAALTQSVLDASPVTQQQAEAWAAGQIITPAAAARLRKQGYDPKKFRADMAEFYRLTGGRLAKVKVDSKGDRRANATGIHGHNSSVINLDGNFSKRVLFHELAHHLEADPVALAAARGFLLKRRESDQTHSLRDLTGNKGYRANEVAFKDSWFSEYIGKSYADVTEVFSMGIESFSDPLTLADRVARDPEMFALMVGFMKTPPNPLFGTVKKVFAQAANAEAEVTTEQASERDQALDRLAAGVDFINRGDELSPVGKAYAASYGGTFVGAYEGMELYECKSVRDPATKRKKAGFLLVDPSRRTARALFGGMQEIKATAKLWHRGDFYANLADAKKAVQLAQTYAP